MYDESLRPKFDEFEATPEAVAQAEVLYQAWEAKRNFCSCVQFAKELTGYDKVVGAAKNWPINATIPSVGGVVILNEGNVGHIAFITSIGLNSFTIVEANYQSCRKTTRTLLLTNPDIRGYWKGVK